MKIYVASEPANWRVSADLMGALRAKGHTITFDWTKDAILETVLRAPPPVGRCGQAQAVGVREAEALIFLDPGIITAYGALMEFGAAALSGKPCVVVGISGWRVEATPFYRLPNVRHAADTVAALAMVDDLPPRKATWSDVSDHYDHDAIAPYVPRSAVKTRFSLGGYDGPLVGLVQYEGRWLLADCVDRDSHERVFWLVDIGRERIAKLLDYAERRFEAYGGGYNADGTRDESKPFGTLGDNHGTAEFISASSAWQDANPMPKSDPMPGDPVIGYFFNWRSQS